MSNKSGNKFIRKIRERLGMTQQGISEKMGCSRSTYHNFESGKTSVLSHAAQKFIEATGCDEAELVLGITMPKNQDGTLMQEPDFDQIRKDIIADYEGRLERKNMEIESLNKQLNEKIQMIAAQDRTIGNLERENARMEKRLARYEAD